MQVYCVDGPHQGRAIEVACHRDFDVIHYDCDDLQSRMSDPAAQPSRFRYRIHTWAECEPVSRRMLWAFPAWRFVEWSIADLAWAKMMCREVAASVVEIRSIDVAAVGIVLREHALKARRLVSPTIRTHVRLPTPPSGFVWPVEYSNLTYLEELPSKGTTPHE